MPLFVQAASGTGTSGSATVTLGSNTTAGNCLVDCIALGNANGLASVTSVTLGGAADNWAQLKAVGDLTTGAEQLATWADPNCTGGQTSVVTNLTLALVCLCWVFEFSGIVTSSPLDQSVTFDSGAGTNSTFSVTTGTTSQASEVAVGSVYGYNTTTTGPSSPWVNEATISSTTRRLQAGYNILSSVGTVTYSGSFGAAAFNGQILVTLKATAAAGTNGTVQPLATVPVPRRKPSRAITQFIPVTTFNTGHGPAGTIQPLATFATPPRRRPSRVVTGFIPVTTVNTGHGTAGTVQPVAVPAAAPRRRPSRSITGFIPVTTTNATTVVPVGPPPVIPTSGGDRGVTIRVFREIRPGDVPGMGAQLPKLTGRAFAMPVPADTEHVTHSWEAPEEPGPGLLDQVAAAGQALEGLAARAGQLAKSAGPWTLKTTGEVFDALELPRKPVQRTCGKVHRLGNVRLVCRRRPGHVGKHSDRGLDWR